MYYSTHQVLKSHVKFSQADFLYPSVLLVPIRLNLQLTLLVIQPRNGHWPTVNTYHVIANRPGYWRVVGTKGNAECWTEFTELLHGNALINPVTTFSDAISNAGYRKLVQVLRFWTLSSVLFLSETRSCLFFKTQCLGDWMLFPKRWVLNIKRKVFR
jgi:hypothetical protein